MAQQPFTSNVQSLTSPGASGFVASPVQDTTTAVAVGTGLPLVQAAAGDIYGAHIAKEVTELSDELTGAQTEMAAAEAKWRNSPESKKLESFSEYEKAGMTTNQLRIKRQAVYAQAITAYPQLKSRIDRQMRMDFGDGVDEDNVTSAQARMEQPLSPTEVRMQKAKEKAIAQGTSIQTVFEEQEYAQAQALHRRQTDKYGANAAVEAHTFNNFVSDTVKTTAQATGGALMPEDKARLQEDFTTQIDQSANTFQEQCMMDGGDPVQCQEIGDRYRKDTTRNMNTYLDKYDIIKKIDRNTEAQKKITRFNLHRYIPDAADLLAEGILKEEQLSDYFAMLSGDTMAATRLHNQMSEGSFDLVEDSAKKARKSMQENGWAVSDIIYKGDPEGLKSVRGESTSKAASDRAEGKGATKSGVGYATAVHYSDPNFGHVSFVVGMTNHPEETQQLSVNMIESDPRYFQIFNTPQYKNVMDKHPEYGNFMNELVKVNVTKNIRPLLSQTTSNPNVGIRETEDENYQPARDEVMYKLTDNKGLSHNIVVTTDADLSSDSAQLAVTGVRDSLQFYYNNPKLGASPIKRVQGMINSQDEDEIVENPEKEMEGGEFVPPSLDETPLSFKPRGVESLSEGDVAKVLTTNQGKRYYLQHPEKRGEVEPALQRYVDNSVIPYMPTEYRGGLEVRPASLDNAAGAVMIPDSEGNLVEANNALTAKVHDLVRAVKKQDYLLEDGETAEEYVEDIINGQYIKPEGSVPQVGIEQEETDPRLEAMARQVQGTDDPDAPQAVPQSGVKPQLFDWSNFPTPERERQQEAEGEVLQPESPEDVKGPQDEPSDAEQYKAEWEIQADKWMEQGLSLSEVHDHWVEMFGEPDNWSHQTTQQFNIIKDRYVKQGGDMEDTF
jgi:hypothetical protein